MLFRLACRLVHLVGPFLVRGLLGSCRLTIQNRRAEDETLGRGQPVVGAIWHQTAFFPFYRYWRRRCVVLVSMSRDGEIGAALMEGLGHRVVRGSSSRGGSDALRELVDRGRSGLSLA